MDKKLVQNEKYWRTENKRIEEKETEEYRKRNIFFLHLIFVPKSRFSLAMADNFLSNRSPDVVDGRLLPWTLFGILCRSV